MARARNNVTLAVTLGQPAAKHGVAPALIHQSTWKGNSAKFGCSIMHSPHLIGLRTAPQQNQLTGEGGKGNCFGDSGGVLRPRQPKDDSGRYLLWSKRRVRRGGLRSAGRPADGCLALGALVPLCSFATIVLRGRALWGRCFRGSKELGKCEYATGEGIAPWGGEELAQGGRP